MFPQLTVNITDVLNKDLKHSCRWWASFDLFRRLLFIFIVLFSSYVWPLYNQVREGPLSWMLARVELQGWF